MSSIMSWVALVGGVGIMIFGIVIMLTGKYANIQNQQLYTEDSVKKASKLYGLVDFVMGIVLVVVSLTWFEYLPKFVEWIAVGLLIVLVIIQFVFQKRILVKKDSSEMN